jgi:nitrogen fixation protein FixH
MKLNWGTGIVIALIAFMLFILSFVYKTFTNSKYDHHFVSKDYYKDEINYQKEIDAEKNLEYLESKLIIKNTDKGIEISFPKEFENKKKEGTIYFQRSANEKLDFKTKINTENNIEFISDKNLVKGLYIVKINWKTDGKMYQYKDNFYY